MFPGDVRIHAMALDTWILQCLGVGNTLKSYDHLSLREKEALVCKGE